MHRRFQQWLGTVPVDDLVERRLAPLLQVILLGLIGALGIAIILAVFVAPAGLTLPALLRSAFFVFAMFASMVLLRRGHFQIALWIVIVTLMESQVRSLLTNGLQGRGEALLSTLIPITIAGLLMSRRSLALVFGIYLLVILYVLQTGQDSSTMFLGYALVVGLLAFLIERVGSTLRRELANAIAREVEIEQARAALAQHAADLEREIAERKLLAAENVRLLQQSQNHRAQLQVTLSSIGDAVIATDPDGQVIFINAVAQALTGWQDDSAIGQHLDGVFRIINEETRATVESPVAKVLREGTIVGLANHTLLISKDGRETPIDDSGAPIREDNSGPINGVVLVFRDVTERKREEERRELLQKMTAAFSEALTVHQVADVVVEQGLSALGSHLGTVCIVVDDGATLEILNKKGMSEEIFERYRYTPVGLPGPLTDAINQREVVWIETFEDYVARYPDYEAVIRANGSKATVAVPMMVEGRVIGGITVSFPQPHAANDIEEAFLLTLANQCAQALERARLFEREQAARAKAERADQLKLEFLAMISHELRTPLTSIKGFATTLLADDVQFDPASQREFLLIIDEEANKLTELIEQLLDVSRLQAGALPIHPAPQPLMEIVQASAAQLTVLTELHRFKLDIPTDIPPLLADKQRIAQVLVNLVGNAAKFAPPDTEITVVAYHADGFVQIDVSDEGDGIPETERAQVFEAFRQIERKMLAQKGAGLGLAICKGLVEAHGGRIWIQDRPAPGTTISFTLPLAVAAVEESN